MGRLKPVVVSKVNPETFSQLSHNASAAGHSGTLCAEAAAPPGSYGYCNDFASKATLPRFTPDPTDLVLGSNRNFYQAMPGQAGALLLSVSSLIPRVPDHSLALWF